MSEANFSAPSKQPLALTDRQQAAYAILAKIATDHEPFHQWYWTALSLFASKDSDYLALAAHSIREITDRLPEKLGVRIADSPLQKFKEHLADLSAIRSIEFSSGWSGEISKDLSRILASLESFKGYLDSPARQGRMMAAMEKRDPGHKKLSPRLKKIRKKAFLDVNGFFQNVAHHNKTASDEDFSAKLAAFENHLIAYLTPITVGQQDLIEKIIRGTPTPESTAELDGLLVHSSANFGFLLQNLNNPDWIPYLEEHELFKKPGSPIEGEDGQKYYTSDPALACLARLAPIAPTQVLQVLKNLPQPENPLVPNQIMRCILGFNDPSLVGPSLKLLRKFGGGDLDGDWIYGKDLCLKWLGWEKDQAVIDFLVLYFSTVLSHCDGRYESRSVYFPQELDKEIVHRLSEKNSLPTIMALANLLEEWFRRQWEAFPLKPDERSVNDPILSEFILQETLVDWIESGVRYSYQTAVWQTLLQRVESIAIKVVEEMGTIGLDQIDDILLSTSCPLFNKVRWKIYTNHPEISLDRARADILKRLSLMGNHDFIFSEDLSEMLSVMCAEHGHAFLNESEVAKFADSVFSGPYDEKGPFEFSEYSSQFQIDRLFPIQPLLEGYQQARYRELLQDHSPSIREPMPDNNEIVEHLETDDGESLDPEYFQSHPLEQIWELLNQWEPGEHENRRTQRSIRKRGRAFTSYVVTSPERFQPEVKWWENITTPAILIQLLSGGSDPEQAREGEPPPPPGDWPTWLGIADWFLSQKRLASGDAATEWDKVAGTAATLLASLDKNHPSNKAAERKRLFELLRDFALSRDRKLEAENQPAIHDWLTTAINSGKGRSLDAMAQVTARGLKQNLLTREEYLESFRKILAERPVSPAIFALLGSRLDYLLNSPVNATEEELAFLFPSNSLENHDAFLETRLLYHQSNLQLFRHLPGLVSKNLDLLERRVAKSEVKAVEALKNLGPELAALFMYGHWNDDQNPTSNLHRFFLSAPDNHRAMTISHLARIVRENLNLASLPARNFWENRFAVIKSSSKPMVAYREELSSFLGWLSCESHPASWKIEKAIEVAKTIDTFKTLGRSVEDLAKIAEQPENLQGVMLLLAEMIPKCPDNIHWALDDRVLRPLVATGLKAEDGATVKAAAEVQDSLVRRGLFHYRDFSDL